MWALWMSPIRPQDLFGFLLSRWCGSRMAGSSCSISTHQSVCCSHPLLFCSIFWVACFDGAQAVWCTLLGAFASVPRVFGSRAAKQGTLDPRQFRLGFSRFMVGAGKLVEDLDEVPDLHLLSLNPTCSGFWQAWHSWDRPRRLPSAV